MELLEASQVEYNPFGKPPLQREVSSLKSSIQWRTKSSTANSRAHARGRPAHHFACGPAPQEPCPTGLRRLFSSFSNSENLPRSGFRLRSTPRSVFRLRSTPRSVFRLRFSFRFCPKNPAEAMRWGVHRFRSWVSSRKTHHRASAEGPSAMLSSQYR